MDNYSFDDELDSNNGFLETGALLKAIDVAKRLQISKSLAYRMMQSGEIPTVRFNRSVRVRLRDLEGFIQNHLYSSNRNQY